MKYLSRVALATTLLFPAVAGAQGTAVWAMTGQIPDTVKAMAMGMGPEVLDIRVTVAYDGTRMATQISPGPQMTIPGATFEISNIRLNVIFSKQSDSIHIGIVLPPEITAMLGGGIGYRFDLKLPDSLPMPMFDGDSLKGMMDTLTMPKGTNTGRTSTVAGMACEEWTFVMPVTEADSAPEKVTMCLAPTLALLKQIGDDFMNMPIFRQFKLGEFKDRSREMFGGRDIMPIRVAMIQDGKGFTFELVSISNSAPDASFFTLPVDLQPFPMEMLGGAVNQ